jgi:hypothetical protein
MSIRFVSYYLFACCRADFKNSAGTYFVGHHKQNGILPAHRGQ